MLKKIIIFEGFSSAGKTTVIKKLSNFLKNDFRVEILDNNHSKYASLFINNYEDLSLFKSKYTPFCFRWTKLFLFFNWIKYSNSNLFFFDRGVFSNYIFGKLDDVPEEMLNDLINNFMNLIKENNYIYKTVFVDCDLEIANKRSAFRKNVDVNAKIRRNELFAPYFKNIAKYYFINDIFTINSSCYTYDNFDKLVQFIKG